MKESLSSKGAKWYLRLLKYNAPYKTRDFKLDDIRKNDIDKPGKRMHKGCLLEKQKLFFGTIWHLAPKTIKNNKLIIYFHGGGYVGGMVKQQWTTIAKIAVQSGSKVIIPEYPLAPEGDCEQVISMVSESYNWMLKTYQTQDIVFLGESAGGGLLLSFALFLKEEERPLPSKLIALSPWVDVGLDNPDAKELEKDDPLIAVAGLKRAGEMYANRLPVNHYLVSPLYGDLAGLPPTCIYAGTHDILFPDEKIYAEKSNAAGVKTFYFEYPKMLHAWMFMPIREAKTSLKKIVQNILEEDW